MDIKDVSKICNEIVKEVNKAYIGKEEIVKKLLATSLVNGNVLFEDSPGLGKTLLSKAFAKALGLNYKRVQFTPDLLPSDVIGTKIFKQDIGEFKLVKGPIFTNILLADEINRAPPKTQAALLEAMEEKQVSIEGDTIKLDAPFFVIATQNPLEHEGTYPLPEAQLDRFSVKLSLGCPRNIDEEMKILKARINWKKDDPTEDIERVIDRRIFLEMQRFAEEEIYISEDVLRYISNVVVSIRNDYRVEEGPSPRGSLTLLKLSKSNALLEGRDFVLPDDVKKFAVEVLFHRIILKPEHAFSNITPKDVVENVLRNVPVPKTD
jgi:MoxR-like ATPase